MAIGDSFTYGWGVPAEDSWPKILERRLQARGYDVEVATLGQPWPCASLTISANPWSCSLPVQQAIASVSWELRRIRKASERSQARVIVVSVPLGVYISPRKLETYGQIGFVVENEMLQTTRVDEAGRDASFRAGLDFYEVTHPFREVAGRRDLFFKFDGHFNIAGCRLFAEGIEPFVTAELDDLGGSAKQNRR